MLFLPQVSRPLSMKKDGIQTRNRKLSSKKKKKGMMGYPDMLRCDKNGSVGTNFPGFGPHYNSMYMYNNHQQIAAAILGGGNPGGLVGSAGQAGYHGPQHHPSIHGMSAGLAAATGGGAMGLGGGFCTVGA